MVVKKYQVPGTVPSGKPPKSEPYRTVPCRTMQWKSATKQPTVSTGPAQRVLEQPAAAGTAKKAMEQNQPDLFSLPNQDLLALTLLQQSQILVWPGDLLRLKTSPAQQYLVPQYQALLSM